MEADLVLHQRVIDLPKTLARGFRDFVDKALPKFQSANRAHFVRAAAENGRKLGESISKLAVSNKHFHVEIHQAIEAEEKAAADKLMPHQQIKDILFDTVAATIHCASDSLNLNNELDALKIDQLGLAQLITDLEDVFDTDIFVTEVGADDPLDSFTDLQSIFDYLCSLEIKKPA